MDLTPYFATFAAFVGTISLVSEGIEHLFHLDGLAAQIRSWVLAFIVALVAHFLGLGIFGELSDILTVALYGLGGGLVANGIFSIDIVRAILKTVLATKNKGRG
jgi:hypothetical protein